MINKHILNRFPKLLREWLLTAEGQMFYWKFLFIKGCHVLIRGLTGSGKTRKLLYLVQFLKELETIVWFDSCKDEEIAHLWFMDKPVNIIIPEFCNIDISIKPKLVSKFTRELGDDPEKKEGYQYTSRYSFWDLDTQPAKVTWKRYKNPAEHKITRAALPILFWNFIEPGSINIFSIHAYFKDDKKRSQFYADIFKHLAVMANEREYFRDVLKIARMCICVDEGQRVLPSLSYTRDSERIDSSQAVTTNILEVRAVGIRLAIATQADRMIYPGARDQMPSTILCCRAQVKSEESKLLHKLCEYAEYYGVDEGLFVFYDGDYLPRDSPWSWPNFVKPKGSRIRYSGKFDEQREKDEVDTRSDVGIHASKMIRKEVEKPAVSLGDLPCVPELYEEDLPVTFVDVWNLTEEKNGETA